MSSLRRKLHTVSVKMAKQIVMDLNEFAKKIERLEIKPTKKFLNNLLEDTPLRLYKRGDKYLLYVNQDGHILIISSEIMENRKKLVEILISYRNKLIRKLNEKRKGV